MPDWLQPRIVEGEACLEINRPARLEPAFCAGETAILDSTKRDDIVLDPYLGSGTTILAAERTGRRGYGVELDPLYVDTAIARWERVTGAQARHSSGKIFADVKAERSRKS
jgi:DNA modification methylase